MSGRLAIDSVLAVGAPAAGGIGGLSGDVARSVSRMGLPGVVCARDSPIPAAGAGAAAAVVSPRAGADGIAGVTGATGAAGVVGTAGAAEIAGAGGTTEATGADGTAETVGAAGIAGTGGAAEIAGAGWIAGGADTVGAVGGSAGADPFAVVPVFGVASTDPAVAMSAVAASWAGEGESSNTHTATAHRARLAAKRYIPRSRCMMSSGVGRLSVGPHDSPIRAGSGYRVGFARIGFASPEISPIREARARRWLVSQGERESERAGVPVGTSSTLAAPMSHSTQRKQSDPCPQP